MRSSSSSKYAAELNGSLTEPFDLMEAVSEAWVVPSNDPNSGTSRRRRWQWSAQFLSKFVEKSLQPWLHLPGDHGKAIQELIKRLDIFLLWGWGFEELAVEAAASSPSSSHSDFLL